MVLMATNDVYRKVIEREFLPEMDALYGFAYHLTYDEMIAEDLVSDTLEKAIKNIGGYQQGTNARAWLFTIMRNHFINDYRKKQRGPNRVDFEDVAFALPDKDLPNIPAMMDWTDETLKEIVGDEVSAAMDRLHPDFRTVIILSDLLDFKYEEIAETMNIPVGTVRSRLYRARTTLASELKDYAEFNGYNDNRNKD
ncbi:MAG: sigma-70 family RNA polymerase sigma factor [Saprospiraceae bacterium]